VLPIKWLPDPFRARDDAHWYRDAIIDEIGKQFLEPRGLDIWEMYGSVIRKVNSSTDGALDVRGALGDVSEICKTETTSR
jgi:hypothetical protein